MAVIFPTTFSHAFSWMKMCTYRLRFHWSLLPVVQLTIFQYWFRQWLGAGQAISHYLNQWWLIYGRMYASLGFNELNPFSERGPRCVVYVPVWRFLDMYARTVCLCVFGLTVDVCMQWNMSYYLIKHDPHYLDKIQTKYCSLQKGLMIWYMALEIHSTLSLYKVNVVHQIYSLKYSAHLCWPQACDKPTIWENVQLKKYDPLKINCMLSTLNKAHSCTWE